MAKDYIPKTDGDLAAYLGNFQIQVGIVGPALGLSAAEIATAVAACTDTYIKIGAAAIKKNVSQLATAEKDLSRKNTITMIRSLVRRMKAHPAFDGCKGQLLNIIGEDDTEQQKPHANAKVIPGGIQINFTKFQFDGVNVYRKRSNQTAFEKLAFDRVSPYIDNDTLLVIGQPERREYYVSGVINDVEAGEASDVLNVVYGG